MRVGPYSCADARSWETPLSQNNLPTPVYGVNPSGLQKQLQVDANGSLITTSESGGDAVTLAAGAVAAGAYVSGSVLSGAFADGAIATIGLKADAADSTAAAGSLIALIKGLQLPLNDVHQTVAASSTATILGTTGAAGDWLDQIILVPAVAACGLASLLDGATTLFTFPGGGTTALPSLAPIVIPIKARATTAWKITTGANIAVFATGTFT